MRPEYMLCLGRILDGARTGDFAKVKAYAEFLADKMRENGDVKEAKRVIEALNGTGRKVHLAFAAGEGEK